MKEKYCLIIKTGESEIRALENSSNEVIDSIFPVIEITRGRKKTINDSFCAPFDNRLNKLKLILKNKVVGIDVTSSEFLSSTEVDLLYDTSDGYCNWIEFLRNLNEERVFSEIIPAILVNNEDEDFKENLVKQVSSLKTLFTSLIYRTSIEDDFSCYEDLILLKETLNDVHLYVLIDCEYTPQASYLNVAEKCIARINNLKKIVKADTTFIVTSTSFPNNISDIGDSLYDELKNSEVDIVKKVQDSCGEDVMYSDYGSISVRRNDGVIMARGWIPRIDVPTGLSTFYYKLRRPQGTTAYSSTYNRVARQAVSDPKFPKFSNWGIKQIIECAKGVNPSSSPSFWISVRMCIHIEQQVRRLMKDL